MPISIPGLTNPGFEQPPTPSSPRVLSQGSFRLVFHHQLGRRRCLFCTFSKLLCWVCLPKDLVAPALATRKLVWTAAGQLLILLGTWNSIDDSRTGRLQHPPGAGGAGVRSDTDRNKKGDGKREVRFLDVPNCSEQSFRKGRIGLP